MEHFNPELQAGDAAQNTRSFIKSHMETFWDIFKPLMPYIIGLALIDAIITAFIMPENVEGEKGGFGLGGLITSYFYTCLAISWHRVIIHGPDRYTPMNPFKPQRSEWAFIGMGIGIGITIALLSIVAFGITVLITPILAILWIPFLIFMIFVSARLSFYFPAKATGNNITLKQAFDMSKGYIWKFMTAGFFSSWRMILAAIGYSFLMLFMVGILFEIGQFMGLESKAPIHILMTALNMPILLYFQPIVTIIGVTVLSNYYQHALRKQTQAPQANHENSNPQ